MLIAVGSINPVKIEAVKLAFEKVWPDKTWVVQGIEVNSRVSNQPMSDEESIKGARNRAKQAIKGLNWDFGVGLEGGLQKIGKNWFECGWVVVIRKDGVEGIGSSIKLEVPNTLMKLIKKGIELGEANDIVFKVKNSKQQQGFFGIATNNTITRTLGYRDGVITALARFLHPGIF